MDPELDHKIWRSQLQESIDASYKAVSADEAYAVTDHMLQGLGDPFTRLLRPGRQTTAFQNTTEGQIVALGLHLAEAPGDQLQVGLVLNGSPAQAAGIEAGDTLLEVNGSSVQGRSKEDLALDLKLEADLKLLRQPGLLSQPTEAPSQGSLAALSGPTPIPPPSSAEASGAYTVHLKPGPIEVHPVQFSALTSDDGSSTGYIRLVVFSQNATADVQHAIQVLQQQEQASSFILDLRDNAGGVVAAGYGVAQLLMQDGDGFCIVKYGMGEEEVVQMQETTHVVTQPLVVLVNGGTASASELLAGALHDARNVPLIGEKTFGKGVTQRVVPLSDGSTLLLSTASYMTPKRLPVHKVGLQPDVACKPEVTSSEYFVAGSRAAEGLSQDPCIKLASTELQKLAKGRASGPAGLATGSVDISMRTKGDGPQL